MPEKSKPAEPATDQEFQIKLCTKLENLSVADTTFNVPSSINSSGLNNLVQGLLENVEGKSLEFEWLCLGELLRGKLAEHVSTRNDITAETVIELEYIEKNLPPEPQISANHDDWVSSVAVLDNLVLTGCYDNTVNLWTLEGQKTLVIPSHSGPVKAVAWLDEETFVSASHDQTINMFQWNKESNSVEGVNTCRGHERSVECVAVWKGVEGSNTVFASGSFDNTVKLWGGKLVEEEQVPDGGTQPKKAKPAGRGVTRTPMQTLGGHKEAVSGLAWLGEGDLASASWDHTIKIWDMEMGGLKTELVGNKAFFSISYSNLNRTLLASSADRSVRMYDPRSQEGSLVKAVFTSHVGWVSSVSWAPQGENLFVSASHDQLVKMWDNRSYKTPLYELTGHSEKVLCCDWSNMAYVASGGADNHMKIFKSKIS